MSSIDKMKRTILQDISDKAYQCNARLENDFYNAKERIAEDKAVFSDQAIVDAGITKIDHKLRKNAEQFIKNLPPDLDMVYEPSVSVSFYTISFSWNSNYFIAVSEKNVEVKNCNKRVVLPNVNVQGKQREIMNRFFLDLSIDIL